MLWSSTLIPTLRSVSAEADIISHQLMLKAGLIRKLSSGLYTLLPLGLRVVRKIEEIVREEMNSAGARELLMPILSPAELWKKTGRWEVYGEEMMKVKDRHEREFGLGPTHEEVITDLISREVRSYRDMPLNLYQIQVKFRDEIRPRFGIMRAREFIMKDSYSFDVDDASADITYKKMYDAYMKIFTGMKLKFRPVEANTGAIGGNFSHEFMVLADAGEEAIISCTKCTYAANRERAGGEEPLKAEISSKEQKQIEKVSTPKMKTVEEVSRFLKSDPSKIIKTMLYHADGNIIAVLVKGNHEVNEQKVAAVLNMASITLILPETIEKLTGIPNGFAGPVKLKSNIKIIADKEVMKSGDYIAGANEFDSHLIHVYPNRDFKAGIEADVRWTNEGDLCPKCGSKLEISRGIEVGQVFKLGKKYSESLGAAFTDEKGETKHIVMGCYGIGITRIAAAAIEQCHDENGIIWPVSIAPYQILISPVNMGDEAIKTGAEEIYNILIKENFEVLFDDRDVSAGIKFKDADLIGIPIRITIGGKFKEKGMIEIKKRNESTPIFIPKEEMLAKIKELLLQ